MIQMLKVNTTLTSKFARNSQQMGIKLYNLFLVDFWYELFKIKIDEFLYVR